MFEISGAQHPLTAVGAAVAEAADAALASSGLSLSVGELRGALVGLHAAQAKTEAARLHLVRLLVGREESPLHRGGATVHWMTHTLHTGRGRARSDLAAAAATCPDTGVLRGLGAALAEGAVSRAHVDVATHTLPRLPTGLVRERREDVDRVLTDHARSFSPTDSTLLAKHLIATVAPDGLEDVDDDTHERRSWSVRVDRSGMVEVNGRLDGADGAVYRALLEALANRDRPDESGTDRRTWAQRLADAAVEMARLATAALAGDSATLQAARVVIHCTPEQLTHPDGGDHADPGDHVDPAGDVDADPAPHATHGPADSDGEDVQSCPPPGAATCEATGPLSRRVLHRHACDAVFERVVLDRAGAVVQLETLGRLANRAQRRALAARDGGCAYPECAAPVRWTEAHHVIWWSRGGRTVLINLVLLCPRHHTEIHREHWTITMVDGVPWFIPPPWIDPTRTPVRNTLHLAISRTREAGQRLTSGHALGGGP